VEYKLTQDVNIYASGAKGFRSGGVNGFNQQTYTPEDIRTYELGEKMSLLGGNLSADAAVFWSDYKDYQIYGIPAPPAPPFAVTSNAGKARIKGIELDLSWRPAEQWTLGLNGDYLDTKFTRINATNTAYAVGDNLDFIPKYMFTVSAERELTWRGKKGFARLDYNQQGRDTYRNRSFGPQAYGESDVINMLNFNTGAQWNDQWSWKFFVRNLLNDRGYVDPQAFFGSAARSRPRTVGIDFTVKFD
jgi:outer membrane receptor protein involved in Fe transport